MRRDALVLLGVLGLGALGATAGCRVHVVGPVRHHRHLFWFYPALHVYWSPSLRVYWYRDSGRWIRVRTLPSHLTIRSSSYVELDCDHEDPYVEYDAHVRKYPPGRYKRDQAPGRAGTAPGRAGTSPGRSGDAPGRSGDAPGRSGDAPGHNKGGPAPGQGPGKSNPGKGHGGGNPGGGHGKGKKK